MTHRQRRTTSLVAAASAGLAVALVAADGGGCNSGRASTQPSTPSQRQDAILRDPMNYKPQVGPGTADDGVTHFDSDGFKKDLNDVFNP